MSFASLLNAVLRRNEQGKSRQLDDRSLSRTMTILLQQCDTDPDFENKFIILALTHGHILLNDKIFVQNLPRRLLGRLISDAFIRCDEATIIKSLYTKFKQYQQSIPEEVSEQANVRTTFFALLCCIQLRFLTARFTRIEKSRIRFFKIADHFRLRNSISCILPESHRPRGTNLKETVQLDDVIDDGIQGIIDTVYQEEGSVCKVQFGVAVRKTLDQIIFDASVPKGLVLMNDRQVLTVVAHWYEDGELHSTFVNWSDEVLYDSDPTTSRHHETIGLQFGHTELLPMKKYELRVSLQDITNIYDANLKISTLHILF